MAGLLRPPAAPQLVSALRERFDLPVHLHTHDTAGGQLATLLAAVDAGVDAVDVASAPMAGHHLASCRRRRWSRPWRTPSGRPKLDLRAVMDLEPYWEAVRKVYAPFESGLPAPTGRVYDHEIPGGQLSNLRQQAIALGLGEKFEQIEAMYAAASRDPRPADQGDPVVEGGRRPGPAAGGGRGGSRRSSPRTRRTTTSPTR